MHILNFGTKDYHTVYRDMVEHVDHRIQQKHTAALFDSIWWGEHYPVYTTGMSGDLDIATRFSAIPTCRVDRGGQLTYHGPGQLIIYPIIHLSERRLFPKRYVALLEQAVIEWLRGFEIAPHRRLRAPGVYVNGDKIVSIGIRVRHGYAYHGIAINLTLDLQPFSGIVPCGLNALRVSKLSAFGITTDVHDAASSLLPIISECLTNG